MLTEETLYFAALWAADEALPGTTFHMIASAIRASCDGTRLEDLRVRAFPESLSSKTMHQAALAIRHAVNDKRMLDFVDPHKPRGPLRILRCLAKALVLESKRLGYHNLRDPNDPLPYLRL